MYEFVNPDLPVIVLSEPAFYEDFVDSLACPNDSVPSPTVNSSPTLLATLTTEYIQVGLLSAYEYKGRNH